MSMCFVLGVEITSLYQLSNAVHVRMCVKFLIGMSSFLKRIFYRIFPRSIYYCCISFPFRTRKDFLEE